MYRVIFTAMAAMFLFVGITACEQQEAERAGQQIEKAVKNAGEAVSDTAKKAGGEIRQWVDQAGGDKQAKEKPADAKERKKAEGARTER